MKKHLLALFVAATSVPGVVLADPVTISTTDVVAQLGVINTTIAAIGTALLIAAGIAVAFKWAKASVFG